MQNVSWPIGFRPKVVEPFLVKPIMLSQWIFDNRKTYFATLKPSNLVHFLPYVNTALSTLTLLEHAYQTRYYCIEGIEMRQLVFWSADVYCQNLNNLKSTLTLILYANGKKGKQANSERDRERECARV